MTGSNGGQLGERHGEPLSRVPAACPIGWQTEGYCGQQRISQEVPLTCELMVRARMTGQFPS
jgi:hypothetical protein